MEMQHNDAVMSCGDFQMQFNQQGALVQLTDPSGKVGNFMAATL